MRSAFFREGSRNLISTGQQSEHHKHNLLARRRSMGLRLPGNRSTSTIPAGAIGNEKDLTTTHDEWYSPALKVVIQSTQIDPRFGQTTYSLTDIEQGPPDQALFQVPPDYKVEEIPLPKPAN